MGLGCSQFPSTVYQALAAGESLAMIILLVELSNRGASDLSTQDLSVFDCRLHSLSFCQKIPVFPWPIEKTISII
ncbi:hypothetical protein PAXRUDRAFT_640512 [Paxillus rubicundulus Ve08.2h10]|uniref:Uncharacterized protein n=1 Tax=Paxillus rubicundulus Ve08.2h10 TaxID=930991 RepID=A0A0D0DSP2_9AGAM|nr:hypothetical protein PAXRUDRAFT_640512 [Paxillus rubicundulus Ve08.2h10]